MPFNVGPGRNVGPTHVTGKPTRRARRYQQTIRPSNVSVGPESSTSRGAQKAAKQFVDRHVSIDSRGFPSLLPSATQGIAQAVHAVQHPDAARLPSAPSSVVSASGQGTAPADPSVSVRLWNQMHGKDTGAVKIPKPKSTTPGAYRQARQTEKQGEQKVQSERRTFFSAHRSHPLSSFGLGEHITVGGYPKTYKGQVERQAKQLKKPPLFGHSEQTGGAYSMSEAVGPGGAPVQRTSAGERGPVGTGFKIAGTALQFAPFAATADIGRGALKIGLNRIAREEAANVIKTQGVKQATKQTFPRLSKVASAVKGAPAAAREAPGAIRGAARRTPATAAIVAGTPEGRVAAARQIANTAYHYKASTTIALSQAAKEANAEPPGVKQVNAFVTGTKNALTKNPLHTLKTTARALPGAITAPVSLTASGVESAIHGNIGPLKQEATTQFEGAFFHPGPKRGILEKMLSGDPKVVEKAVTNEGGLAFLSLIPGITRTGAYKDVRGQVREGAAAARRFSEPVLRENRGKVLGVPIRPRIAPKGVERNVFRASERRQEGLRVAKIRAREEGPFKLAAGEHEKAVLEASGRLPKKMKEGHVAEALQTLLANGIRDKKGFDYIKKHGPKSEEVPEGGINFKAAMDIMEAHPEMWTDKHVKAYIAAGEKMSDTTPAQKAGAGDVARFSEQSTAHRNRYRSEGKPIPPALLHPTEHVPSRATQFTRATTREEAWADVKRLEKEGKTKQAKGLRQALDPYTRPEHSQDFATTSRIPYDNQMRINHVKAVEAENAKAGLAPGRYTHHGLMREAAAGRGEARYPRSPGGLEHSRAAGDNPESLAARDVMDRSLLAYVQGTGHLPRNRAAGKAFARGVVRDSVASRFPVRIEGEVKNVAGENIDRPMLYDDYVKATSPKNKDNPDGGQYDRKSMGWFPMNEVKNALDDPFTTEGEFQTLVKNAAEEKATHPRDEVGFMLPRRAIEEWRHQIQGDLGRLSQGMSKLAGVATAGILGTNPTWAMVQIPAEGIPLALAHPSVLWKAPGIELSIREIRRKDPEAAHWLEGSMGANPGRSGAIRRAEQTTGGYGQQEVPNAETLAEQGKQLTRGPLARAFDSAIHLRPLRTFDVRRQREQSAIAAITIADKRFRSLHSHLKSLVEREATLSGKFYGRPRSEMLDWLSHTAEGKAEWRNIREDLYNTLGNWDAFTQLEREAAPFTIFYTFLRYAVQWPLWLFPRAHPVTALITYFLAQQNANRLEKIAGMKHGLPSGDEYLYSLPVYTTDKMKNGHYTSATLPVGSRISPGQSVIQGAVMSKNPAQALGSSNPFVGSFITLMTGTTPFGTQTTQPKGWAALNQLIPGLSALRYVPGLNAEKIVTAITTGHPTSDPASILSQAFDRLDPNRRLRSFGAPWIPMTGAKFKQREQLTNALKMAHDNSTAARQKLREDYASKVAAAKGSMKHKLFNEGVLKDEAMHRKGTEAGDTIDRILSDLGLGVQNKKSFAAYLGITKMAEPPFGQTPHRPTGPTTTSPGTPKTAQAASVTPLPTSLKLQANKTALATQSAAVTASHFPKTPKQQLQLAAAVTGKKPTATPTQVKAAQAASNANKAAAPAATGDAFADTVSKRTGLDPRVVAAWATIEGGNGGNNFNVLNIGGGHDESINSQFSDPKRGGALTAQFLKGKKFGASPQIQNIVRQAKGKSPQQQLQIIANSGWATDPNYASKLASTYNSLAKTATVTAPKQAANVLRWTSNVIGTQEGSPRQQKWAAQAGVSASAPWCSVFVAAALRKVGIAPPANPAYSGSWLDWKGGQQIHNLKAAKPGDLLIFDWGDGGITDHVGIYQGHGQYISGNHGNTVGVSSVPSGNVVGVVRPKYRGRPVKVAVGGLGSGTVSGGGITGGGGGAGGGGGVSGGGSGTVAGMQGGLSSKYTPPDYVGLTASSHSISPITGIIKGTGSSSTASLIGGTRATASGKFGSLTATGTPLSASANISKLPKLPKPSTRRRRSSGVR